jgi:hypothetical protein
MNLVERQVRELARQGATDFFVWVTPQTRPAAGRLRADLHRLYRVAVEFVEVEDGGALCAALGQLEEDVLLLEGDVVYDERVLAHVLEKGPGAAVCGTQGTGIAYLSAAAAGALAGQWPPNGPLGHALEQGGAGKVHLDRPEDLDPYVPSLRLTMAPYMRRAGEGEDLRELDHLMYRRTFKGVLDAVALYGYYHLVRWITRHLSRTGLPPNLFTLLSMACVWGAAPLLAAGYLGGGVLLAWTGVILDSVDGKLARLRLHLSQAMGALEHLAAMPGLGLWYLATGWHLAGGQVLTPGKAATATWVLLVAFVLDKVVTGAFKALCGRELFDYDRLDALFHLVAARRNIHLLMLTVGVLADRVETAFMAMAAWMGATLFFHLGRFAWIAARRFQGGGGRLLT